MEIIKYVTRSGCLSRVSYASVTIGWMLEEAYVIQLTTPCILRSVLSRIVWVDKLFCPCGRDEGHRDSHVGFARGLNPYNKRKEEPLLSLPSPLTYTQVKRLLTGTRSRLHFMMSGKTYVPSCVCESAASRLCCTLSSAFLRSSRSVSVKRNARDSNPSLSGRVTWLA